MIPQVSNWMVLGIPLKTIKRLAEAGQQSITLASPQPGIHRQEHVSLPLSYF